FRLERALRRDYPRQLFFALLVYFFVASSARLDYFLSSSFFRPGSSAVRVSSSLLLQKFSRALEKFSVADRALLDRLAPPCCQLARRQRTQSLGVNQHGSGLVERADEVLARARVDAGLAADRRVYLREQRRRHLHESYPAQVDRGGEAREVSDDSAAERDDGVAPLQTRLRQKFERALHRPKSLEALAVAHHPMRDPEARAAQRRDRARAVEFEHASVRDERHAPSLLHEVRARDRAETRQRAGPDLDGVTPASLQTHLDAQHLFLTSLF